MNMLGLNPNEQEVIDIPNHVARLQKLFSNAATYVAMTCSGTTWSTSPTFARSCWTGCATQQRRRCLLVTCPTRSPSSRKNRNLVKGLRRRRRAQLPAHHLQGSSNIVFDMQQIKLQHMCGTEPFPTEFRAKKYKLEKHFLSKVDRFVVSQCWIPIFLLRRISSLSCRTYRSMSPMKTLLRGAPPQQIILENFPNTQ